MSYRCLVVRTTELNIAAPILEDWTLMDWTVNNDRFCPLQLQQRWRVSNRDLLIYPALVYQSLEFICL